MESFATQQQRLVSYLEACETMHEREEFQAIFKEAPEEEAEGEAGGQAALAYKQFYQSGKTLKREVNKYMSTFVDGELSGDKPEAYQYL